MLTSGLSLPFYIDNLYSGLAKVDGLLKLTGESLVIEFQTQDNVIGMFKGSSKTKQVPLNQVFKAEIKTRWWDRSITIRPSTLSAIDGIPGVDKGQLKIKFRKADQEIAKNIVSQLNLRLSEIRLQELDE